jgi:ABC-type transport system involved in multi-copper enzyme maturation permease subunit
MGSNGLTSTLGPRMMPFLAILRHDLHTLLGSWLVRLWLGGTVLLTLVTAMGNWAQFQTAPMIAALLFPYLVFPWFLVVMVLGIHPVSGSRAEALADGVLSRPVTRHEYLLAAWLARIVVVLGVYLVVMIPMICLLALLDRPVPEDTVTLYGISAALGLVALVLTFQVSLAFLLGTLLRKQLLTIVVLLVVWYPVNGILYAFQLEEFSPISLSQALPTLLRQPWREVEGAVQDEASDEEMEALARQAANLLNLFSGGAPKEVAKSNPGFFEREEFDDFSLSRVLLGYGVPTLLALGLATLCFSLRDL